jgi:hypothetical protein
MGIGNFFKNLAFSSDPNNLAHIFYEVGNSGSKVLNGAFGVLRVKPSFLGDDITLERMRDSRFEESCKTLTQADKNLLRKFINRLKINVNLNDLYASAAKSKAAFGRIASAVAHNEVPKHSDIKLCFLQGKDTKSAQMDQVKFQAAMLVSEMTVLAALQSEKSTALYDASALIFPNEHLLEFPKHHKSMENFFNYVQNIVEREKSEAQKARTEQFAEAAAAQKLNPTPERVAPIVTPTISSPSAAFSLGKTADYITKMKEIPVLGAGIRVHQLGKELSEVARVIHVDNPYELVLGQALTSEAAMDYVIAAFALKAEAVKPLEGKNHDDALTAMIHIPKPQHSADADGRDAAKLLFWIEANRQKLREASELGAEAVAELVDTAVPVQEILARHEAWRTPLYAITPQGVAHQATLARMMREQMIVLPTVALGTATQRDNLVRAVLTFSHDKEPHARLSGSFNAKLMAHITVNSMVKSMVPEKELSVAS